VEIDSRVCGLGLEVNVDYLAAHVIDLRGEHVASERRSLDVAKLGPEATMDELAALAQQTISQSAAVGRDVSGVTVAIPGFVATKDGIAREAPNLGWKEIAVADELAARLNGPSKPFRVDNDANLSALAEFAMGSRAGTRNLLYLTGETGVGGGVIADGKLVRGAAGFGGEVGHMGIAEPRHLCGCGRRGCWETTVGLAALLRAIAEPGDDVADPAIDLEMRLAEIRRRAELGDGRTLRGLECVGISLGLGASILIHVVNPRVLVLGGYFAALGDFLLPTMFSELERRVVIPGRGDCDVVLSDLGFSAAGRGGAHVALEAVLADPTSVAVVA
jgi:predicted NBD/HSP70 family sugar kinase